MNLLCGKKLLELGCGHGLPGIYALKYGANVHFQDYNEEVIEQLTIPNVFLNFPEKKENDLISRIRFFSGDWNSINVFLCLKLTFRNS